MILAPIQPGDIVLGDVKGRRFHATVTGKDKTGLAVEPIERGVTYRHLAANQVKGHWRQRRRRTRTQGEQG